jgi:hypothetical protein
VELPFQVIDVVLRRPGCAEEFLKRCRQLRGKFDGLPVRHRVQPSAMSLELRLDVLPTLMGNISVMFGALSRNRDRSMSWSAFHLVDRFSAVGREPLIAPVLAHLGVQEY